MTEKIILRFKNGDTLAMANFGGLDEINLPVRSEVPSRFSKKYQRSIFSFAFLDSYMDILDNSSGLKLDVGRYRVFDQIKVEIVGG